jgi:hypothetical protein
LWVSSDGSYQASRLPIHFSGQKQGIWKADAEKKSEVHASHINFTHRDTGQEIDYAAARS